MINYRIKALIRDQKINFIERSRLYESFWPNNAF